MTNKQMKDKKLEATLKRIQFSFSTENMAWYRDSCQSEAQYLIEKDDVRTLIKDAEAKGKAEALKSIENIKKIQPLHDCNENPKELCACLDDTVDTDNAFWVTNIQFDKIKEGKID